MSVKIARVFVPHSLPSATIALASVRAAALVCMKAAPRNFTSRMSASKLSASFLERIEAVMSGMLGTVPLASRRAYIFLSAGTIVSVWPQMTQPTL